jgi:hypothetical protein
MKLKRWFANPIVIAASVEFAIIAAIVFHALNRS